MHAFHEGAVSPVWEIGLNFVCSYTEYLLVLHSIVLMYLKSKIDILK